VLFSPEMGGFDMAVGKEIVSAFTGAADYLSFPSTQKPSETKTIKVEISESEKELHKMYHLVREIRENKGSTKPLQSIFTRLKEEYPNDWLLPLEIYELTKDKGVLDYLKQLKVAKPKVGHLIVGGLELV
jgi:phenylalanine-4-hydroxylase